MDDNLSRKNEFSILGQDNDLESINEVKKEYDIDDFEPQLKFEENEIKVDLNIKKAKFFFIENIIIINISKNKSFDTLYMAIDVKSPSKNLLFSHDIIAYKNPTIYRVAPMGEPLLKGEKLTNTPSFEIKQPKIGEYTIYIYLREKPNGDNLSSPLIITVNLIEDSENIERKEEEKEDNFKEEEDIKRMKEKNENIDYKGVDKIKVEEIFNNLDDEYNICSKFDKEEVINKIIEFNCDKRKINNWICKNL